MNEESKIYVVCEPDDYVMIHMVTSDKEQAMAVARRYYDNGAYGIRVYEFVDGSDKWPKLLKLGFNSSAKD